MPTTAPAKRRRETTYEKAERLISEKRYLADHRSSAPDFWVGVVQGDHGNYAVFSISPEFMERYGITGGRLGCNCRAGRHGRVPCSHALLAEEMRRRGKKS